MAKVYGVEIAKCPACGKSVGDENPYAWCLNCGEQLPKEIFVKTIAYTTQTAITEAAAANAQA